VPELNLQISEAELRDVNARASESGLTLRDFMRVALDLPDHASSERTQAKERNEEWERRFDAMTSMHVLRRLRGERPRVRDRGARHDVHRAGGVPPMWRAVGAGMSTVFGRTVSQAHTVECLHCDWTETSESRSGNALRMAVRKHVKETGHVTAMVTKSTRVFKAQPVESREAERPVRGTV
jgi:hypothetical protein